MILLWSDWMASYNRLYSPTIYVCMLVSLKPVLRGRIWDKEKWSYKTGDLVRGAMIFLGLDKKSMTALAGSIIC